MIGLVGGAFDPPHNGHVALARGAIERLGVAPVTFLVAAAPGHRSVATPAAQRLQLARAAFSDLGEVLLDGHPRTVDAVADGRFGDAVFVVGADQFADFLSWTDPNGVLERVRLGVGTRPGYPRERLQDVLARLERPDRVLFFDVDPVAISSSDVRARVARGEAISELVPPSVAELVEKLGLYRPVHSP